MAAGNAAVRRAGDTVVSMAELPAQARPPAEVSRAEVTESDVYMLIAGFRYGPLVPGMSMSYLELEFQAATEQGVPRLVVLLDEDAQGPVSLFVDYDNGARQVAFRERLIGSGVVTAIVASPEAPEEALFRALSELPRASSNAARAWNILARLPVFVGRERELDQLATALASPGSAAVVQARHGTGGIGTTTLALEYAHRHARDHDMPGGCLPGRRRRSRNVFVAEPRSTDLIYERVCP